MAITYYRSTTDPNDWEQVHMVASDNREDFSAWLDLSFPNHTKLRSPHFRSLYDRDQWLFYCKVNDDIIFEQAVRELESITHETISI